MKIINNASVKFSYILEDRAKGEKVSNIVANIINMRINNFKQIDIQEYLDIPDEKPNMEVINSVDGKIKQC